MVEQRRRFSETDRPVAGAMIDQDHEERRQAVTGFKDQRRELGHHEEVERPEEIQIVAIDQKFGGRNERSEDAIKASCANRPQTQMDHTDTRRRGTAPQPEQKTMNKRI